MNALETENALLRSQLHDAQAQAQRDSATIERLRACGWQVDGPSDAGCYLGTPIIGAPKPRQADAEAVLDRIDPDGQREDRP